MDQRILCSYHCWLLWPGANRLWKIHVCIHTYIHEHTYTHNAHVNKYTYTHEYMHTGIPTPRYMQHIYTLHTCKHTHIYTHIHTYLYIYIFFYYDNGRRWEVKPPSSGCCLQRWCHFLCLWASLASETFTLPGSLYQSSLPQLPSRSSQQPQSLTWLRPHCFSGGYVYMPYFNISTSTQIDIYFSIRNWLWPPTSVEAVKLLSWQLAKLAFYWQNPFHTFTFLLNVTF